jgi:hypothetical protein
MGKADEEMAAATRRRLQEMGWTPPDTPQLADAVTMGFPLGVVRALARYVEIDYLDEPMPGEVADRALDALAWLRKHHLYKIEVMM